MIVGRSPRIRQTFSTAWHALGALFVWDVAVTAFYFLSPFKAPALPLTIFGTALALLLGFRVNSAYQRWWEARTLWGLMTNASRSYARATTAFLAATPDGVKLAHDLVLRQIAYVHALRHQLRREDPRPDMAATLDRENPPELTFRNPANALLTESGRRLARAQGAGWVDTIRQTQIERLMVDMSNAQGGMERIKNTPLPAHYASFPTFFTRIFCILLPIGLVESMGIATPIGSALAGFMFLAMLQIGDDLVDPFAGAVHDVPLTAMCLTIEADLRESIGESPPPALAPVKNVLW